ncbi:hypothetical protein HPB50_014108 [Hyalomma asiaticum]|uniref:Uncharacterized protein n=1 Tax=Hyalomma asiaticum TaxID=266040 RepID=A0ACB7T1U3_HYAAI|nr:hypothetical protein HPB50_014108 [Hyalomma asiaticum]
MQILKKKQRVIRAQATRIINEADEILAKQAPAPDIVAKQLSDVNAAIEPDIIDDDADAEFEQVMETICKGLIDLKPVTSARNVRELRRLFDDLQVHMRGLKALGVGEDSYNTMLYPVLLRALPQEMILNYHRSQPDLCTSSTDGSSSAGSATEDQAALTTLLRYFRRELESQERALEHRPDNSIECSRKLGCKLLGTDILAVGVFGGKQKPDSFRRVEVRLLSKDNCKEEYVFDALEVPTICEQVIPCPDEQVRKLCGNCRCHSVMILSSKTRLSMSS